MSTQTVASGVVELIPSARGFGAAVNKEISGDLAKAGETGGRKAGSALGGSLAKWGKRAAVGAAVGIGATFGTALVKGFGRLQAIEQAEAKLTGLGHSAESVEQIMTNATAAVKGTAFGLGDAASAAASAVASGVKPGKDLERTLKLVGDSAAIAGADYGEMAAIFNKVSAGGIIQGEELAQLGDRGIPILQLLADEMGVTAGEVKKLASEGKVDFETFQNAMEAGMGGAAQESGKTFSGAMANVGAALGRIGASLLSGVFPKIAPMLQNVIGWLDKLTPVAEKVGTAIGDALSWVGDAAQALFDVFVKGDFNKTFREAFGVEEDHPVVGVLFKIRDTALAVWDEITGGFRAFAAAWRYNDGEITSSGFPGVMEKVGYWARQAFDYIRGTVIPAIQTFVEEFRNGEGAGGKFRDVLEGIWAKAQDAFGYIKDTVLPALGDLWKWLSDNRDIVIAVGAAVLGYKGYMMALHVWTKAVTIATTIWTGVQKALNLVMKLNPIGLLIAAITALVGVIIYAYRENETFRNIVDRVWAGIKSAISATVTWFKDTAWPWLRDALGNIRDRFVSTKDRVVGAWDAIRSGISTGWDAIKGIFDRFKDGLNSLRERFTSVKNGIRDIWSGLTRAIAGPIRTVVQFINDRFLGPLESALNKIPGVDVSLARIPVPGLPNSATGGGSGRAVAALAAGGVVPGPWRGPRADNVLGIGPDGTPLARINPREYVTQVSAVQHYGTRLLDLVNQRRADIVPRRATGGIVGGRGNEQPGATRTGGFLADSWEWLVDVVKDAGGWVRRKIEDLLSGIGSSWPAQAAVGAAKSGIDGLGSWIRDNIFGGGGGPGGSGRVNYPGGYGQHPTGMPWQNIWALIKSVVPNAIMTSNFRGGAVTASGIPSLHGLGRAVDWVTPGMVGMTQAFRKVGAIMKWSQHFYTPAGPGFQQGYVDDIIRRTHRDHGHTALGRGGLVPFVADSGALLRPGLNVLDNRTGGPEPLIRADHPITISADSIEDLLEGVGQLLTRAAGEHARTSRRLERQG